MSKYELELQHDGQTYVVHLDLDWVYEDDSFDGHLGGRVHTFERGHWSVGDYTIDECLLVGEDDDEEVDPDIIHGLSKAIDHAVSELTKDND